MALALAGSSAALADQRAALVVRNAALPIHWSLSSGAGRC
jgi:hypothetical protein